MRMDQVESKSSEEELANEARVRPLGFARVLCYVARFFFTRCSDRYVAHVRLRKITSPMIAIAASENHWMAQFWCGSSSSGAGSTRGGAWRVSAESMRTR